MTLADLKRAAELLGKGASITLPCEAVLAALAEVDCVVVPAPVASRLMTVPEVAARTSMSRKYIYKHAAEWPFTRRLPGEKALRFESAGLERWLARQV